MRWWMNGDSGWVWGMHLVWWLFWVVLAIGLSWAVTRGSTTVLHTRRESPPAQRKGEKR